jgi:hypothetical protein
MVFRDKTPPTKTIPGVEWRGRYPANPILLKNILFSNLENIASISVTTHLKLMIYRCLIKELMI